ncbi:juvenile hormone acid O-methyltransferase-like [Temnothorax americanus]|uniref:juvenile hormone acid O-methyltransferase-like n=1 Tax=Temnothorax americanus TaxID=1964332 RepID=UPI004068A1E6
MGSPNNYIASNEVQKSKILHIIDEFSEDLKDVRGKCMDIGCGPGDTTKNFLLPNLGSDAQIIGTDISESMIKYANKTFNDKKRLHFEVLDIQTKNLPKKYISEFNHIFSFHTLQWCNDIRQAFTNIYQMLQPNGTILLYIVASHDVYEVLKILERNIRFAQYIPDMMKNISPFQDSNNARKDLKELLQSIGFTIHHCSLRETSYSEEKSIQFLSTDISESMIKYANKTFNDKKRLHFEVLDIQTKNLPEKYISEFNHIFSFHTLQWCNDIRQAFRNMYQMLRPNGTILLYIIASHDMCEVYKILERNIRFAQYIPDAMKNVFPFHGSNNARKDLKELLQSVGFTIHHCSLREASYSEEKLRQFLNSIISLLTFLEDMPKDLMEEFKNTLTCEFLKRKINYKSIYNNQELTLDLYEVLVVYAQKI